MYLRSAVGCKPREAVLYPDLCWLEMCVRMCVMYTVVAIVIAVLPHVVTQMVMLVSSRTTVKMVSAHTGGIIEGARKA